MFTVKTPLNAEPNFIDKVLQLDEENYAEQYRGTKESVMSRYEKNTESYLLLYDDDKMVGYICFFPINDAFAKRIYASPTIYDDNIAPSDICAYNTSETLNLYIISICIKDAYRGGNGVKLLMRGLAQFVKTKLAQNVKINKIIASATSEKGKSTLVKAGFTSVKCGEDFELMETRPGGIDLAIKSDVLIFSQCVKIGDADICCGADDKYVEGMKSTTDYEFAKHIATRVKRHFLKDIKIEITSDTGRAVLEHPVCGKLYLTEFDKIYIVTLLLTDLTADPTYVLDQSTSDTLIAVADSGERVPYNTFLRNVFSLEKIGLNRNCVILNEKLFPEYMACLLASEAYNSDYISALLAADAEHSEYMDTNIVAREYVEKAERDLAQYGMSEIYAADKTVVEVLHFCSSSFEERFRRENLLIFIIEMLSLQMCSIEQINNSVLASIENSTEKDAFGTEKEFDEFGQTYRLWNLNYYKYSLSDNLHMHLEKEFRIAELKSAYEASRATLKSMFQTKNDIKNKKNASRVNSLLLIFTLLSGFNTIVGFIAQFVGVSSAKFPQTVNLFVSCVIFVVFLITYIFLKFGNKFKK